MTKSHSQVAHEPNHSPPGPPAPPPVHWSEKIVLLLLAAHLTYLPWALGAMHLGSQWISLGLSGVAFLAAVALNPPSVTVFPKRAVWKKLAASPVFWLGGAFLGYILIQALNPAFKAVALGGEYWMVPIDHIEWLPISMDAPFEKVNAMRRLMVFGSAFLTIWTICLFVERPRSLRFLLWILTLNGVGLAVLAFGQLFTGAEEIFWRIPSASEAFYSSFIYRNHAASHLNLLLALSIGMYFYYRERSWRSNGKETDKSPIFFFSSTILFTAVLFSNSRAGITIAVALLLLAIGYTFIQAWRWKRLRETTLISGIFFGMLILFASVFTAVIGPERILDRFERLAAPEGELPFEFRLQAYRATNDMFRERWLFGWGAGSFEYAFPKFQHEYPEIHYQEGRGRRPTVFMVWEYAHNDWLQYAAEYGVVGGGLLLVGLLAWLGALFRYGAMRHPVPVWLAIGVFVTLVHGVVDFVLQNPATIILFAAAIAISLRLAALERGRRGNRRSAAARG